MFGPAVVAALIWELTAILACILITRRSPVLTKAPILDIVLAALVWFPWVVGAATAGWIGFLGIFTGQFIALQIFCIVHTATARCPGPRIRHALDRIVGPLRNHLGLWITLPALPVFLGIRAGEVFCYPLLVIILRFPNIRQDEWVTVSRQKFEGLVGHDLVWCLYCDWMTGVYSLGAEMLRNVESFWCPIKFYDNKKCENCRLDFPDIDRWARADGTMFDVVKLLEKHYPLGGKAPRGWWGRSHTKPRKKKP